MSQATLIFDGDCGFCTRSAKWIYKRVGNQIELLPCQDPRRALDFPTIEQEHCMEAMWLITADGTYYRAQDALPQILRMMPRWRLIAWVCELPGIRHISPHIYRLIANNRYALSALMTTKPANACPIDGQRGST